jgi:hypothetical protein
LKKQPDDSATAVPTVKVSTTDVRASEEGTNSLAIIANASIETIGTIPDAIGTSTDVGQDKKDPPLT